MNEKLIKESKVAVLGFGLEGRDLAKFLLDNGVSVTIFDKEKESELGIDKTMKDKVSLVCGENYLAKGLRNFDAIYKSPGIYRYIPELISAEKAGVEISSAIKLFFDLCPAKIIGVTGTKGKGTTSTLIYQILKNSGKDVFLAGNIGKPYLELLPKLKKTSWVVLELSSFQLIDLHESPHISVVLNITSDHLDWHKDNKEYVDAKKNILKYQAKKDFAVINADYKATRDFGELTNAVVRHFSKSKQVKGCFVKDNIITLSTGGNRYEIGDVNDLLLRGKHNWENICAAVIASKLAGASLRDIKKTVFKFKGLEHRLELVGEVKGRKFYNDSFATGPLPTIAALQSFEEPTTVILGGYDKGLDYSKLGEEISRRKNIMTVILIGDVAQKIKKVLIKHRYKGKVLELGKSKMEKIVKLAFENTPKGGVVLLSPAAASFDMFENYKERGNQFKDVVKRIVNSRL